MVTQVLDAGLVRTQGDYGGWTVTTIESSHGLARVRPQDGITEIFVGETCDGGSTSSNPCRAYSAAACTPEGDALVLTREAPPAILVTAAFHRTSPADPGMRSLEHLEVGERLVMLSSASFEDMPDLLAALLRSAPAKLLRSDPANLLAELFQAVGQGAGAIIERLPAHEHTGEHR